MQPILKWAGGKDKELKYIIPALPAAFEDYYEPFVGGGAVFLAVNARHYFINDLSTELISLYRNIAVRSRVFYAFANMIDRAWSSADAFFYAHQQLVDMYMDYRADRIDKVILTQSIDAFCRDNRDSIVGIVDRRLALDAGFLIVEMIKNLSRKMLRMKELELRMHMLPDDDVSDNIHTAVKSALYMYFRHLYNNRQIAGLDPGLYCALFLFIRNYCYSGMFRYNDDGDFNVPYGGIAYNNKSMSAKLDYYRSDILRERMEATTVDNLDFEAFFRLHNPGPEDFVFLDPPYDSEFSTYARNEFTRADHARLAGYLINECHARWMLVIKNTDYILGLYNHPGINLRAFDKTYQVSFMNRNDRTAQHLLITNY